ncbi:MAG: dephospho-CoA kinase [Bacteroidetes bacterium]|nr:dephospho-CoA kinase [Bacteroidota bacterium]MBS1940678.1 dephospho-CoA kinase [Bacteroidota bacterium]
MWKVGLTGGIGSGKTTVAKVFAVLGVPVFSSDGEGRRLLAEDGAVQQEVRRAFGNAVIKAGVPDRKALAALVFSDGEALARLNGIIHPAVRASFAAWAALQHAPYVINEAAILVESGIHRQLDHLVVVEAPERERIQRVVLRDGIPEDAVHARMAKQTTDRARAEAADSVINNDGTILVIPQVLAVHRKILQLAAA